jgi:cell wall-associated NlpC family hydrolase
MPVGTPLRALLRAFAGSAVAVVLVVGSTATAEAVTPGTVSGASVTQAQASGQQLVRQSDRKAARKARKARKKRVGRMLQIVRAQKGDPYQYGAAGPNRFDCSGLVYYSTHRAGFRNVPRTSSQQGGDVTWTK